MKKIPIETVAYYIFDRGYNNFKELYRIHRAESFFVVRAKTNLQYKCIKWRRRLPKGILTDAEIELTIYGSQKGYPEHLRLVRFFDEEQAFRSECLRTTYGLFLLELNAIQERTIRDRRFPKRIEELFFDFLRLVPIHFAEHHDVAFYASQLCITPRYLSQIVREVSGRTVVDYINQMLLIEASYMLKQTSFPIVQIADHLHFSEPASFTRFFTRMKGMNPREFRKGIHDF